MSAARRIGILAGGGSLPREIAESVAARGMPLHIVAIDGEADADLRAYPVTRVNWGEIGRMVSAFKEAGCTDLIIIGSVKRPDLATIKPDMGFVRALGTVAGLVLAGGDDGVLRGVISFFERQGLRVVGPAQIAPELVIGPGALSKKLPDDALMADARLGFEIVATLGAFDIGQAIVIRNGNIEALEAAEGTDRMLVRLAAKRLAGGDSIAHAHGVLVKRSKPSQDVRIDLPVIGPDTVTRAVEAGLAGLAIEAGKALAADRNELMERVRTSGISVVGLELPDGGAQSSESGGAHKIGRKSWTARAIAALRKRRSARTAALQQLGKKPIPGRVLLDTQKGLDVLNVMQRYGGSRAVVIVRGHVLAVETGEGIIDAMQRAAGLRQWGDRRLRRRAGCIVADAGREFTPELVALVAKAGFAGLLVKLRRFTAGVPPEAIEAADKAGLFVAGINVEEGGRHA